MFAILWHPDKTIQNHIIPYNNGADLVVVSPIFAFHIFMKHDEQACSVYEMPKIIDKNHVFDKIIN
jgi:hypothetical protein